RRRWWQTKDGPMLDTGAFVAGLEYAAQVEATVLGKPSSAYFAAACEALDADPGMTWMVGDDLESDIAGAQGTGLRTVLVRTGKFRPDGVARAFAWKEIEIVGRPKPSVRLSGRVAAVAEQTGIGAIDLSMTHSRELAQAVAVTSDA